MNVLGLIPARRGSRRLPGKNTRLLGGKPLIVWTIEAARKSKLITQLVCSTDDERVMEICREHGVDILLRPAHLATDEARTEDVVLHALEFYPCDYVCLLQPTSPFRTAEDIDACIEAAQEDGISVTVTLGKGTHRKPNGAVYVASVKDFREFGFEWPFVSFMPDERSLDIDTLENFEQAEEYASVLRVA